MKIESNGFPQAPVSQHKYYGLLMDELDVSHFGGVSFAFIFPAVVSFPQHGRMNGQEEHSRHP